MALREFAQTPRGKKCEPTRLSFAGVTWVATKTGYRTGWIVDAFCFSKHGATPVFACPNFAIVL
jgi:hypothetical protein